MFLGLPDPPSYPLSEVQIRGSGSLPKFHGSATLEPGKETTFDLQYVVSQIIMIECSGLTQGPRQLPVCGAGEQSGPGQ